VNKFQIAIDIKKTKKKSDKSKYNHLIKKKVLIDNIFSKIGVNILLLQNSSTKYCCYKKCR
jgi:hypothetical protein